MKIGLIREGKIPPDSRVLLSPRQCAEIMDAFPVQIVVEPSPIRCYKDAEYEAAGIRLSTDLSDCDVLCGIKEVPIHQLIEGKTYFFFSHTIKKQEHNRKLLQALLARHIRLFDYETLTDEKGDRLIAFGFFAGVVGAHNAMWMCGQRTGTFRLPRMNTFLHYADAVAFYRTLQLPPVKIVLTGSGRVATGADQVLSDFGIHKVSPSAFLHKKFNHAVYTQLNSRDYVGRKDGMPYSRTDFHANPAEYKSTFTPYSHKADILVNGIYWNPAAPALFTLEEMQDPDFSIRMIADITCDIAPTSSIPSTIRASSIPSPVYGFNPVTNQETAPFKSDSVDVMAIDNLPNELPRDASEFFGQLFIDKILPELISGQLCGVLLRSMITDAGTLTPRYSYLSDFASGV